MTTTSRPSPETASAPGPTLLADRAYEGLRDRIVTLQIRPGEPIDEDRVAPSWGMGRTPVREAIKRLALERLVTVYPRRGTFAADINITDLAQISDVRAMRRGDMPAARAAERLTDDPEGRTAASSQGRALCRPGVTPRSARADGARHPRAPLHLPLPPTTATSLTAATATSTCRCGSGTSALDRMPTLSAHVRRAPQRCWQRDRQGRRGPSARGCSPPTCRRSSGGSARVL